MSLLDTALSLAGYIPEPFVAPIPTGSNVDVFTLQNGVPLRFFVRNHKIGWFEFEPRKDRVVANRQAEIIEIVNYLEALPRFYVIACIPSGEMEWMVVPFNGSDADQRGWKNAEPRPMYLCNERIEPFDLIVARRLGSILLYDCPDFRLSSFDTINLVNGQWPNTRDWYNARRIVDEWMKKAEEEARKNLVKTQLEQIDNKLKFLLEFMGASLVSKQKKGNGYEVVWQAPDGHTYRMGVGESGRISVAGFCLAGTDADHNLSSIVQVMEEAHRQRRPDVGHAYANPSIEEDDDDY